MEIERDTLPWREGWTIHPPPVSHAAGIPMGGGFRLLAARGEIAGRESGRVWRIRIPCSAATVTGCLSSGVVFEENGQSHVVFASAPGTLCGESGAEVTVELLAPSHEVQRTGPDQVSIQTPGFSVSLVTERKPDGTRWALVCSKGDAHESLVQAKAALAVSASDEWGKLLAQRKQLLASVDCDDALRPALIESVEWIFGALRPASGSLPGLWIETNPATREMEISRALAIFPALCRIDAEKAGALLQTILQLEEHDHSLPASVGSDHSSILHYCPLPLLAQATLALWHAMPSLNLPSAVAPRLVRLLLRQIEYFEAVPQQVCHWRRAAEALIPDVHDESLASPDVAALLLAEIEAIEELTRPFPDFAETLAPLLAAKARIEASLETFFWDEKKLSFVSRYLDGRPIARITAASALPLLANSIPAARCEQIVRLIEPSGPLRTTYGIANWARWENDEAAAPASPLVQMLLLHAMRRHKLDGHAAILERDLRDFLAGAQRKSGRLPSELLPDHAASASPLETAALVIQLAFGGAQEDRQSPKLTSPFLDWLDRQRNGIVAAAAILVVAGILTLVLPGLLNRSPDEVTPEATLGLAQMHYQQGDYRAAIQDYEALLNSPLRDAQAVDFHLGNAWFHLGGFAQAETSYRAALARNPDQPRAWLNLALALFREKKFDEAAARYRDFVTTFGSFYPDLADRARLAQRLCEEQKRR